MLRKLSKNARLTLSILFVFIGLALISYTYFGTIKSNLFNYKNILIVEKQILLSENVEEVNEEASEVEENPQTPDSEPTEDVPTTKPKNNNSGKDNYIGYLEVPDVKIKRGFVSPDSKYNSIGYNVTIIKGSTMPDVDKGNFILAAHRGNSRVSFFDKLYKIKDDAYAYVTYKGKKYKYQLVNRYLEPKDGSLTIRRNRNKTVLTLITCTRNDKKSQTVFIFELVNVE